MFSKTLSDGHTKGRGFPSGDSGNLKTQRRCDGRSSGFLANTRSEGRAASENWGRYADTCCKKSVVPVSDVRLRGLQDAEAQGKLIMRVPGTGLCLPGVLTLTLFVCLVPASTVDFSHCPLVL